MCTLIDPVAVEARRRVPKVLRIDGHVGESRPAGHKGKGRCYPPSFSTLWNFLTAKR